MKLQLNKQMTNDQIAQVFGFISGVLELTETNRFRVRAYENAAAVIAQLDQPLTEMFKQNSDFDDIPGIGKTLNQKLIELFQTGNIKAFQKYVQDVRAGTFPLWKIPGLGVKRGIKLASEFQLDDEATALEKLLAAAQAGRIRDLPGFGEKSEKEIIEAINRSKDQIKHRMPLAEATAIAQNLIDQIKDCPTVTKIEALGSLRRQAETIGDIDLGLCVKSVEKLKACLQDIPQISQVVVSGQQLIRLHLKSGQQVDIKLATAEEWGSFLQHFTGSKEHNIRLREFALKQHKSLSEHGIKITQGPEQGQLKKFASEKAFYRYLGLDLIPPDLRIGGQEIDQAKLSS
jgi:DNA polymerase (family 10)